MLTEELPDLPINEVLAELTLRLSERDEAVLQAPPGAGKTTVVPLALLDQAWLGGRKILVLEPRRMAARAAAARMAQLVGEPLGKTVGYRIRLESCVSDQTRIEVITEGILTRRLQSDPGLEDVGLVIFDEFHERNLDSDLCLALALQGRTVFREGPPLKLLLMSATLDGEAVAALLGDAPMVTSQGRQYPVNTQYGAAYELRDSIAAPVVSAVRQALVAHEGSVLVFLPGQREIGRVARELAQVLDQQGDSSVLVSPLHGSLSIDRQQDVLRPAPPGKRKVVLATNIAETSLTIEGVSVVIDSGLAREGVFDPATGMTRLTTRRISRASADQREGRAGRQGPGHCYRLWSEEQHGRLEPRASAEILQADLAPLALQLLAWGIDDSSELQWLDLPPAAPYNQAVTILEQCGAVFVNDGGRHQLTPHGVRLAQMPLHPRLAHMLLVGCDIHATETACLLAAILSERNPLAERGVDVRGTVAVLMGESRCPPQYQRWFRRVWQQARHYARLATDIHKPRDFALGVTTEDMFGVLLASAYPDRVARLRPGGDGTVYQLSNGRSAVVPAGDSLRGSEWLAVAELGGRSGESADRIYSASALNPATFREILSTLVREQEFVEWDYSNDRFVAESRSMVGSILLESRPMEFVSEESRGRALLGLIKRKGLTVLPWSRNLAQWRSRVSLMHSIHAQDDYNPWPDLSDESLLQSLDVWLLPFLGEVRCLQDFQKLDLKAIMRAMLPWPLPLELERQAPERWVAPSGSNISIDYSQDPPVLAVKLQEMFGCEDTPVIAEGKVPLLVHLLSPAQRPLQVTQDLGSFWRNGYEQVKREMKGRYPKHPWPDDPLVAVATAHTKRRNKNA